jgi:recombination protein RecA
MYGKGISKEGDILDCAVEAKIIEKAGSWYSYEGNRLGQGRENAKIFLAENESTLEKLENELMSKMKSREFAAKNSGGDEFILGSSGD